MSSLGPGAGISPDEKDRRFRDLERDLPEGAEPPRRVRRRTWVGGAVVIVLLAVGSLWGMYRVFGTMGVGIGVVLIVVYASGGAAVAWLALRARMHEEQPLREFVERGAARAPADAGGGRGQ